MKKLLKQQKIIDEVSNFLQSMRSDETEKRFAVINITGDKGSGKSAIANEIIFNLSDKWKIHEIKGDNRNGIARADIVTSRRSEWYLNPGFSLSFGIISLSSSFKFQETDAIFHDIEKQFLKDIKKDYGFSIIFVDNYDNLDEFTRKFINTISSFNKIDKLYKFFPVAFLITSEKKIYDDEELIVYKTEPIEENDIKFLSDSNISQTKAHQVKQIAGNNIKFIKMLIDSKTDVLESISSILDERLKEISTVSRINDIQAIEEICACGAYFEVGFTAEHVFKVINQYSTEQIYDLFVNLNKFFILENSNELCKFTVDEFREAFIERRIDFEFIYFKRMAAFYEKYYDYKYSTRATFEYKILKYDKRDLQKHKTIALIFLSIITNIYKREILDKNGIDKSLDNFQDIQFPVKLKNILYDVAKNELTYNSVDKVALDDYDDILAAELTRIKLMLITKSKCDTESINNLVSSAINYIEKLRETNTEKFLMITLQEAILSETINHSTLFNQFDQQITNIRKFIDDYKAVNFDIYREYRNRLKRKSALYLNCDMSIRYLKDAIEYFREKNNIYELHNCYVNLLGLYAVNSEYNSKECANYKNEFENILKNNKLSFFDSYKYTHNKLLIDYLKEKDSCKTEKEYTALAEKYYNKYKNANVKLKSNIMRLNQISLCCLYDTKQAHTEIDEFLNDLLENRIFDHFYSINLKNLKCMLYIVEKDWQNAEKVLKSMNEKVPIFNGAQRYYLKRVETLTAIIENKVICKNIIDYDNFIYQINEEGRYDLPRYIGEEPSWNFFSKSFLLTDVQYF